MMRIRIRFHKKGKIRFTSHRDVARIWERAFRRAGIAVAYSQGFSPRQKLSFGLALSTGHESEAEFLDVELVDDRYRGQKTWEADGDVSPATEVVESLNAVLPVGMDVVAVAPIEKGDSLQQAVVACTWSMDVDDIGRADARRPGYPAPGTQADRTPGGGGSAAGGPVCVQDEPMDVAGNRPRGAVDGPGCPCPAGEGAGVMRREHTYERERWGPHSRVRRYRID